MEVLQALFIAAKKGSSSAAKAFLAADQLLGVPPALIIGFARGRLNMKAPP